MRAVIVMLVALATIGSAAVQAQDPPPGENSSIIVNVVTGANGTSGNLRLELSGTFSGDPYTVILDQPGDLQPGTSNSYNIIVPHTFCELYQFRLSLVGSDDWLGQQVAIFVDGAQVWYDGVFGDSGPLTASGWRGGTWDGTAAYRSHCTLTPVEIVLTTGANGTVDSPSFTLEGPFSASPYRVTLNQPGDLAAGHTDVYLLQVPMGFCALTGWHLTKPTSSGVDDDWLPQRIDIMVDGTEVYFDGVFYEVGPITAASNVGGTWNGTAAYTTRCAAGLTLNPGLLVQVTPQFVLATATPLLVKPPLTNLNFVVTPTVPLLQINPQVIRPLATPVPNNNAFVAACAGAPTARLSVGAAGRVTAGMSNRLRAQPGTGGAILALIPGGGMFVVLSGPTCADGYNWWQVNYNGVIGWTAEGSGADYFLEPA